MERKIMEAQNWKKGVGMKVMKGGAEPRKHEEGKKEGKEVIRPLNPKWPLSYNIAILTQVFGDRRQIFKVADGGCRAHGSQVELNAV